MIIVQQCCAIGDGHYLEFHWLLDSCLCIFSVPNLTPFTCSNCIITTDCKFQTHMHTHTCTHTHTLTHTLTHTQTNTHNTHDEYSSSSSSLGECITLYTYKLYICFYGYGCGVVTLSWFRVSHIVLCSVVSMAIVEPYPRLGEHASVANYWQCQEFTITHPAIS